MSFNGSGVYTLPLANVVTGTTISSTWANTTLTDIATGLTTCITRDGQSTITANIPFGGFFATNVGIRASDGTVGAPTHSFVNNNDCGDYSIAAGRVGRSIAGVKVQEWAATGILYPTNPAFMAYNSASETNATGDGTSVTVDFDTELSDRGGNFAADTFVAPVTGIFDFAGAVLLSNLGAAHTDYVVELVTNGAGGTFLLRDTLTANDFTVLTIPFAFHSVPMAATNQAFIRVTVSGSTKTVTIYGGANQSTFFSGRLAG